MWIKLSITCYNLAKGLGVPWMASQVEESADRPQDRFLRDLPFKLMPRQLTFFLRSIDLWVILQRINLAYP